MPLATWWLAGYLVIIPELIFLNNEPLWKIITTPVYTFLMSGDTLGNGPLWFFISLFVVKVSGYYISRYKHFYFSSIFIILVGFVLSKYKIILPLSLSTVPIGLLFYFAGYLYSKQSVIFKNKYLIILLILMLVICNYYYSSYVDVHLNKVKYGNYFIFSFASLLTIPVLIYLSEMISSKILSFIGNKSFYFFVLHWPVFYLVKAIYSRILSINMADVHGYIYLLLLISVALSVCLATIKMFGSNQLLFGK